MIISHNNTSQTQWDRGEFKVMIQSAQSSKPMGFCDGSEEDEQEILTMAEGEGADVEIEKKALKSGREVWTIRTIGMDSDTEAEDFG